MKRIFAVGLAIVLCGSSFTVPVKAEESVDDLLLKKGVPASVVETCDEYTKEDIARQIREENADFHGATTSISIPVLDELMEFECSSKEQLKKSGMTEEQIENAEKQVEAFLDLGEKEAVKNYHISRSEYKIYRDTIVNGKKYRRNKKHNVSASGTLASSELSLLFNNSVSTVGKKVNKKTKSYHRNKLTATFCWSKIPVLSTTDYLAITWGGSVFNIHSTSDKIRYYKASGRKYQKVAYSAQIPTTITRDVGGVKYTLPFTYYTAKDRGVYMRSGTCICYLDGAYPTSNANANGSYDAFAQYFHRKGNIAFSISIPLGLCISVGGDYSSSSPVYTSTKLKS